MRLIFLQVEVPDAPVILDEELHLRITSSARPGREEIPHQTGILAAAGLGQLKFHQNLVPLRSRAGLKCNAESEPQILLTNRLRRKELQRIDRKLLPGPWIRNMFVSKRRKAVISAYEEIVAGDVRGIVKRRPVRNDGLCEGIPSQLNRMLKFTSSRQRPLMDIGLVQLRVSAAKLTPGFLLVEAPAILMIEGEVPNGAPTIRNQYGWHELRHVSVTSK